MRAEVLVGGLSIMMYCVRESTILFIAAEATGAPSDPDLGLDTWVSARGAGASCSSSGSTGISSLRERAAPPSAALLVLLRRGAFALLDLEPAGFLLPSD